MKAVTAMWLAWLLVWSGGTTPVAAASTCGGEAVVSCANCCCCARDAGAPATPLGPMQARAVSMEGPAVLFLPTVAGSLVLERSGEDVLRAVFRKAEFSLSAGAGPLFERDCALLI